MEQIGTAVSPYPGETVVEIVESLIRMVREHIDTIDSLLARYVAGTLPTPARVLVEAHLELKADNRRKVANLEAMAGLELMDVDPVALSNRDAMLAAVIGSAAPATAAAVRGGEERIFPKALYDFVGFDANDVPWRTKMPGFKEYELGDIEGCHVNLSGSSRGGPCRRIPMKAASCRWCSMARSVTGAGITVAATSRWPMIRSITVQVPIPAAPALALRSWMRP